MKITKFCDIYNLDLFVSYRRSLYRIGRSGELLNISPWYAFIKYLDIKAENHSISVFGNGNTPEEALEDFIIQISNQKVVVRIDEHNCYTIAVPTLTR